MNDWQEEPIVLRKSYKGPGSSKTAAAVNQAQRSGAQIDTHKKFAAGQNKQHTNDKNTAKLDRENEELHHDRIGMDIGHIIMKARGDKGMTQKELATRINEKPQVVAEYEQGKAIPNQTILTKMERVLNVKLRGKERGLPLSSKSKK